MQQLEGKTAFITGGASGVGFGMAKAFLKAGMKVVITDIRQDHLDWAMNELRDQPVHGICFNVMDREAFRAAADEAEKVFGLVDLVCNNAGVNFFAPIDQSTYEDWDWVLGVNLGGVINGVQTFVPRMMARRAGHICNTASMAAFLAGGGPGIYTCSKYAVRGLTQALRYNLAPYGIAVSMVSPGLVDSRIYDCERSRPQHLATQKSPIPEGFSEQLAKSQKAGMSPEEMGERILAGIRRNDFFIFTHSEFRDEIRKVYDEILAALPDDPVPPQRLAWEENARKRGAQQRAIVEAMKGK